MNGSGRALVIGGTGFIGRAICAGLRADGYDVVAVARRAGTERVHVADLSSAPVAETVALLAETAPRIVVNAAGALWQVDDAAMVACNQELVRRLVGALETLSGPRPRLVQLGSVYEYGAPPGGYQLLDERTVERPISQYARTKLAGTRAVVKAAVAGRIDGTVLRLSTVLGPDAPRGSLFGMLTEQLRNRTETLSVPELDEQRDLVDLRDVVDAVVAAARSHARTPIFNIASGRPTPLNAMVDELIRISGLPVPRVSAPRTVPRRDADGGTQCIDITTARRVLRWTPRRSPQDSLLALWHGSSEIPALL